MQNIPCRAVTIVQLTEARAQDVTKTLLPSAALDGAADVTWGGLSGAAAALPAPHAAGQLQVHGCLHPVAGARFWVVGPALQFGQA